VLAEKSDFTNTLSDLKEVVFPSSFFFSLLLNFSCSFSSEVALHSVVATSLASENGFCEGYLQGLGAFLFFTFTFVVVAKKLNFHLILLL